MKEPDTDEQRRTEKNQIPYATQKEEKISHYQKVVIMQK
jgi:hypothetical protein